MARLCVDQVLALARAGVAVLQRVLRWMGPPSRDYAKLFSAYQHAELKFAVAHRQGLQLVGPQNGVWVVV